jgi:hypothetical protein
LPMERSRLSRASLGGTAVAKSRSNVPVIVITAIVLLAVAGAITYAAVHRGGDATATATGAALPAAPAAPSAPAAPVVAAPPPAAPAQTVSAGAVANDLQRDLQHRHLWSTVAIVGDHVDIHSSTCSDPAMKPVLDRVAGDFKSAGLRRLRCLEESGKLVFARDL